MCEAETFRLPVLSCEQEKHQRHATGIEQGNGGSFELHHADEVAKGGKVYDVDNLNVAPPKHHIDIHRNR
ncbi:hypothetical protein [Pseudomonas sp. MPC6]|uniref:hypothetical protein n=1 Tax=unclassified Pseudomonas TaxID=196821 RepID=UPI0031FF0C52